MSFAGTAFKILLELSLFALVYFFTSSLSSSVRHYFGRSIRTPIQWIAGDIVFCQKLRNQKQENYAYLNEIVNLLSRSYAVILDPPMNDAHDRVNIAWLGDKTRSITVGIKPKYLRPISRLVFHLLSDDQNLLQKYNEMAKSTLPNPFDLFFSKFILNHQQIDNIHLSQWIMYPLDERKIIKRRQKYRWQLRRDVTQEDMSLLHLIEEWYDQSYNSTDDIHVAIRTPTRSFNKENLLRLCRMMYQDNSWKRQSFGRLSKSGDMKLIRRLLKRQVQFVTHSKYEELWIFIQVIYDSNSGYLVPETIRKFAPEMSYLDFSIFCLVVSVFGLCFVA